MASVANDIGLCIYCGSTTGLTREHVLPEGLGGRQSPAGKHEAMVLRRASCEICTKITREFEGDCLARMLPNVRSKLDLVRKDRRRETVSFDTIHFDENGDIIDRHLTTEPQNYPAMMSLPVYKKPLELCPDFANDASFDFEAHQIVGDPRELLHPLLGSGVILERVDPKIFARMICKIAWGWTVCTYGLELCSPLITDFILTGRGDYRQWVGGRTVQAKKGVRHNIESDFNLIGRKKYLVVDVHLFADMGGPKNYVVVGLI